MSRESSSSDSRDTTQRSLGFVGLSALIHVGILVAVALTPNLKAQIGDITGAQAGEPIEFSGVEIADAAAPTALGDSNETTEVLISDVNDTNAVAVAAQPTAAVEKPKVKTASLAKAPALKTTQENGDVEIQAALEKAREEKASAPEPQIAEANPAAAEASASEVAEEKPVITDIAENDPKEEVAAEEKTEAVAATTAGTASGTSIEPASPAALTAPQANGSGTLGRSSGAVGSGVFGVAPGSPIRDVAQLIAMPGNVKPTYPMQDKMLGKQGTTVLIGEVRQDGTISKVALEKSSGSKLMDESALNAFKSWRFQPGQAGLVRNLFQFQLVGDAKEAPAKLRRQ